jgi:hypothetical protein
MRPPRQRARIASLAAIALTLAVPAAAHAWWEDILLHPPSGRVRCDIFTFEAIKGIPSNRAGVDCYILGSKWLIQMFTHGKARVLNRYTIADINNSIHGWAPGELLPYGSARGAQNNTGLPLITCRALKTHRIEHLTCRNLARHGFVLTPSRRTGPAGSSGTEPPPPPRSLAPPPIGALLFFQRESTHTPRQHSAHFGHS